MRLKSSKSSHLLTNSPKSVKGRAGNCAISAGFWSRLGASYQNFIDHRWPDRMGNLEYLQLTLSSSQDEGDDYPDGDRGVAVKEAKPILKRPSLYKVVLLNDDYTPMDFVVEVLERFFAMGREKAVKVMLQVHTQGKGVCGVYTRDIAETKAAQVNQFARENQHPLLCEIEAAGEGDEA